MCSVAGTFGFRRLLSYGEQKAKLLFFAYGREILPRYDSRHERS
jgi:hypothetical protein